MNERSWLACRLILVLLFSACSGGSHGLLPASGIDGAGAIDRSSIPRAVASNLYVANELGNTVTVYAETASSPLRTISNGVKTPVGLAFNSLGDLAVLNYGLSPTDPANNSVTLYDRRSIVPERTFVNVNAPLAEAFDARDNLYVANRAASNVTVHRTAGKTAPSTISKGVDRPYALAFAPNGTLYVANARTVTAYNANSNVLAYTISAGVDKPFALLVDPKGNLFVANFSNSTVTVYAPGSVTVSQTIATGVSGPTALAMDFFGNLYVANFLNNTVTIYTPTTTGQFGQPNTIFQGILGPVALAFDPFGKLYVANYSDNSNGARGSITVYLPKSVFPGLRITKGVVRPYALAFGP